MGLCDNFVGNAIVGNWRGNILSSGQAEVEGVDIMSTGQSEGLFLKTTGDGKVTWDAIDDEITFDNNNVEGDLIVRGDIIEYAAGSIVFTKTSVFTGPLYTGANTLETFDKDKFPVILPLADSKFNCPDKLLNFPFKGVLLKKSFDI